MADTNPNDIEKFVKFTEPKKSVYTTDKVKAHYPKVGTEIQLPPTKAEKWIANGWATTEPEAEGTETKKAGKKA